MAEAMGLARVDALIARVEQAAGAVKAAALNERLHQRIGASLAKRLADRLADLKQRRTSIAGDETSIEWTTIGTEQYEQLFDECLSYVQAAHSRGNDVDADLCEITDLLFEEIADRLSAISWKNYSTFATDDSYDPRTDIIRIRYPLSAVWDIPIAVHEFGHFISRRIQQKRADGSTFLPFEVQKAAVLEQKQAERPDAPQPATANAQSPAQRAIDWPIYMDELFADILATYAIGPAFAFSAVMLRFDPLTSTVHEDGKHPPYADRTFAILETLRRSKGAKTTLAGPIRLVESFWKNACSAVLKDAQPSETDRQWIATQVSTACGSLNAAEATLQFSGWDRAKGIVAQLQSATRPAPQDVPIAEALNAAWMVRFKPGIDPKTIHRNFVALMTDKTARYV